MKSAIIQSAINLSTSDEKIVQEIVHRMSLVPGCVVADYSSDIDHNRTVITLLGGSEGLARAVDELFQVALEKIDISRHRGEHPRMGAVDVIPFTPWGGETMDTCVALARKVGEQVAKGYSLPVYLYGEAALIPEHRDLSHIRRGGYEQLLQDIHRVSDRQPDFGLARVHPSLGAVAIGARKPLVAFNVNLKTDNVVVAKQIAARMKGENGGLSYIKAIGVNLKSRGMVQVAMNLLDFTKSTVVQAYELVRLEARRYGVEVHGAEIIGLVPLECLVDIVGFYLSIPDLKVSQVLEYQLLEKNI